jgi:hypothetical protein
MNGYKLTTYALTAALALSLGLPMIRTAEAEPHHMRSALAQLEAAKRSLEHSSHRDKDGHRAKALALTKQAIGEVKAGMRHHKKGKGGGEQPKPPGDEQPKPPGDEQPKPPGGEETKP